MFLKIGRNLIVQTSRIVSVECTDVGERKDHPINGEGKGEKLPDTVEVTMSVNHDKDYIAYTCDDADFAEVCFALEKLETTKELP